MQVTHSQKVNNLTHVNVELLSIDESQTKLWKKIKLEEQKGKTEFRIGKICKDIYLTRSRCLFHQDYHACINYNEQTTLLIFGLKGYSTFRCANSQRLYTVGPGDIWLVNTNKEPLFRNTPAGQENEMIVIKYASHRLYDAIDTTPKSTHNKISKPAPFHSRIIRLGYQALSDNRLLNLINNNLSTTANRLVAESQALALLARWLEPENSKINTQQCPYKQSIPSSEAIYLQKTIETLTSDLVNPPSLYELAKQVNMSHTKLNRCFKKAYGTTVYHWLRLHRLECAARYLSNDKHNITDIAFQCGFSSASHFSHAFKQHYNCSPAEYREQS